MPEGGTTPLSTASGFQRLLLQQQQQLQQQQLQQTMFFPAAARQQQNLQLLDPENQKRLDMIKAATSAEFKLYKLYVLFNDPVSVKCVQMVRSNSDLDKYVEIINVVEIEKPRWLTGVPAMVDDQKRIYLGKECEMWIKYEASKTMAGIAECSGHSEIQEGLPKVMDGAAALAGVLNMTSFVPQDMVSDLDLINRLNNRDGRGYDSIIQSRNSVAVPPQNPNREHLGLPTQQIGRGNQEEALNNLIGQIEMERNALLNQQHGPHYTQKRMGYAPPATERVENRGFGDTLQNHIQSIQQQRDSVNVSIRRI